MRLSKINIVVFICMAISGYAQNKKIKIDTVNYKIRFLDINTDYAEFSPVFYKDGILFCSNKDRNVGVIYKSANNDLPLVDIYYTTSLSGGAFTKPKPLNKNINSPYSEGPMTLTKDQNKIYFTRNTVSTNKSRLNIFTSNYTEEGQWSEALPVTMGSDKFSYGHPAISPSGEYMIFASNISGGMGGTDLYITYFKDGQWSKPANMGKPINSSGNEITPFIHEKGILYFSSDRSGGQGGFDIYLTSYNNFEWSRPANIGYPVNSSFSDFGIIVSPDLSTGYFSSNRRNGGEDDDIYAFSLGEDQFKNCDTMRKNTLCRTFYEEGTIPTENSPLGYEWELGDGTKKRGREAAHCYQAPGKYTVQLNVVDLISGQVLINEASYEIDIKTNKGPYIESPDTVLIGEQVNFDAAKSSVENGKISKYAWDYGSGLTLFGEKSTYKYYTQGVYKVRLNITYEDSAKVIRNTCVQKNINILSAEVFANAKNGLLTKVFNNSDLKKIYHIKDSQGNKYKIQLATSDKPISDKFKKFEGILKVDEYFDRNVYGYTVGNFNNPLDAYPKLKMIRKIGFKEAVLIAINKNEVVSGNDSTFFVSFDESFTPVKVINQKGKIKDKDGNLLAATIYLENLTTEEKLGEIRCNDPLGSYEMNFPDGELYGYSVAMKGYFPYASNIDLRQENSLSDIDLDIVLYTFEDLQAMDKPIKVVNLFFAPELHEIQSESYQELDRISEFIKENPNEQFEILGHTDNTGSLQFNMQLSQKRANEVANYLIKKGCKKEALFPKGLGNSQPITTNKKLVEINRRVEIKVKTNN